MYLTLFAILALTSSAVGQIHGTFNDVFRGKTSVLGDIGDGLNVQTETTATFTTPANIGFSGRVDGYYKDEVVITLALTLTAATNLPETCKYLYSISEYEVLHHADGDNRGDLPVCVNDGHAGCLVKQRDHVGSYDFDEYWRFPSDLNRRICTHHGFDFETKIYSINDGANYVLTSALPYLAEDYEMNVYKCARGLWTFEYDYVIRDEDGTDEASGTVTLTEGITTVISDDIDVTVKLNDINYNGILDNILVIYDRASGYFRPMSIYNGLPTITGSTGYLHTVGYPSSNVDVAVDVVARTPACDIKQKSCYFKEPVVMDPTSFAYSYSYLTSITGCQHDLTHPGWSEDVEHWRNLHLPGCPACVDGDEGCVAFLAQMPNDVQITTSNCADNYINWDVKFRGVTSVKAEVNSLSASDVISAKADGTWGTEGAEICLVANQGGALYTTGGGGIRLFNSIVTFPGVNVEVCHAGVVESPYSDKLYITDGSVVKVDISGLDNPTEWKPPTDGGHYGPETPGNDASWWSTNWWKVFLIIIGLVACLLLVLHFAPKTDKIAQLADTVKSLYVNKTKQQVEADLQKQPEAKSSSWLPAADKSEGI